MEEAKVHACTSQEVNEGGRASNYFRDLHDEPEFTPERLPTADTVKQIVSPRHKQHESIHTAEPKEPTYGLLVLVSAGIDIAAAILAKQEETNSSTKGMNVK